MTDDRRLARYRLSVCRLPSDLSLVPVSDSTSRQIVRRHLNAHPITDQNADAILAHLPGDRCQYDVFCIVQLNFEKCVGLFVDYSALRGNQVVSCQ